MGKTKSKMINGLHIRIDHRKIGSTGWRKTNLLENLSHLLNWPFQYLHAEGYDQCSDTVSITMEQVMKKIFWASRGTVKELAFEFCSLSYSSFFNFPRPVGKGKRLKDRVLNGKEVCLFPKLKSIEFLIQFHLADSYFYSFLLELAPNITEIKGQPVNLGSVKFWNERSMQLLKSLCLEPFGPELGGTSSLDYDTLKKLIRSEARLRHLIINDDNIISGAPFPSSWFDPLAEILRNSRHTLNELYFCGSELMKFVQLEGFSVSADKSMYFPNMKILRLCMPDIDDPMVERSILRRLSIGANFPKLQQLHIEFGGCCHELEGDEYEWDQEDCPPSNLGITLRTTTHWCNEEPLEYFVKTFPLLTTLHVGINIFFFDDEHAYSFSEVFSSFQHLKQLSLEFDCREYDMPHFSLDAIFCGINFEEAEKLRSDSEKNGLELGRMQIVQARPGLTSASSNEST